MLSPPKTPVLHPLLCLVLPKSCDASGPSPGIASATGVMLPTGWGLLCAVAQLPPHSLAQDWDSPVLLGALTSGMCLGRAWRAAIRAHGHSSHSSGGCPGRLHGASWQPASHSSGEQHQNSHWDRAVPAARADTIAIHLLWGDSQGKPFPSSWGSPGGNTVHNTQHNAPGAGLRVLCRCWRGCEAQGTACSLLLGAWQACREPPPPRSFPYMPLHTALQLGITLPSGQPELWVYSHASFTPSSQCLHGRQG